MSRPLPHRSPGVSSTTVQTAPARSRWLASALLSGILLGTATGSMAADRRVATERFTEYAEVIDVQPIYRETRVREPVQECWTEEKQVIVGYEDVVVHRDTYRSQPSERSQSSGNAIVGGLIGGVIGNQLGRGHSSQSRAGATVAGAIIGGAIANESGNQVSRHRRLPNARHVESRPIYETQSVQRCKRVSESRPEQRLQHYNVTYRYKGREFVTQMPRDPGNRIELQVTVAPARR